MYTRQVGGNRRVVTPDGPASLRVHLVGPHPIVRHFLDRMALSRIVRSCLGTPRERSLDYDQSLSVLIQNIILSPAPLYRIAEWAEPVDPNALGLSDKEKLSLNDDRIARTLDALVSVRAKSLFFRLALHVIKQFELNTRRILRRRPHLDPFLAVAVIHCGLRERGDLVWDLDPALEN
jgi:hypothetical protein